MTNPGLSTTAFKFHDFTDLENKDSESADLYNKRNFKLLLLSTKYNFRKILVAVAVSIM